MIQGIYTATLGMTPLLDKQDQIANNLANINTTGFKQSGLFTKSYHKFLENDAHQPFADNSIKPDEVYLDYSEGPPHVTNQPLDLSVKGSGFFTLMTSDGVAYTRNGNFSVNSEGLLVTSNGSKVMAKDGYIKVDDEFPVTVTDKGEIVQDGEVKGVLKIVDFEKPYKMQRCGDSCFRPLLPNNSEKVSQGYVVRQGYLEGSNVSVVKNMVEMISANRNFEADQRALWAQDQSLDHAVNMVGKVQ
jgi:flagellar basal-body rod protein FlgG